MSLFALASTVDEALWARVARCMTSAAAVSCIASAVASLAFLAASASLAVTFAFI
jgi:hypothetical protein